MSQTDHLPQGMQGGFLKALLSDATANTMAIGAAAMVPLVAMVGGGIDASRFYMAQSRLQAACDAGALAGRRAMDTNKFTEAAVTGDPTPQDISNRFFDENYPDGTFGLEGLKRSYTSNSSGEVIGTVTGDMPTSLMGIFGYQDFGLDVTCSADINISNTDVLFVFDVTGSMQCQPSEGANCSINFPGAGSTVSTSSKLYDLQQAAKSFYDTVDETASPQAQVRYGFVPYNRGVNVGNVLYAANPSYMATEANYQSREPKWDEEWKETDRSRFFDYSNFGPEEDDGFLRWGRGNVSQARCKEFFDEDWSASDKFRFDDWEEQSGTLNYNNGTITGTIQTSATTRVRTGEGATVRQRRGPGTYIYNANADPTRNRCQVGWNMTERTAEVSFEIEEELIREFREWEYRDRTFTIPTSIYTNGSGTFDTGNNVSNSGDVTHFWDGCIEEADTRALSDFSTVPDDAYDLNINLIPANNQQRWRPVLPSVVFYRYLDGYDNRFSSNNYYSFFWYPQSWTTSTVLSKEDKRDVGESGIVCPQNEAQRLTEMTEDAFDTYVDNLRAWGGTYHDSGMIWGARFVSPKGIFATDNASAPNGDAISRHIVFMTDGELDTSNTSYGMYGIEWWDRHVTTDGSRDSMQTNHAERFQAACRAARNENISVWVVAFGTTLTQNLIECATPGRAYSANDAQTLTDNFKEIAEKIAALRLTK